ncbi:MAG: YbdD/YjiX family protein [Gemmatimonadaceae bacterium]|nr:YbdD/YjiX family protein [Gemmatimonadaceae bacterium]
MSSGFWARLAATVRRIIGAPDYAAYVAHVRAHHPEREPMCERDFVAERLNARYEKPGSRCC